LACTVDAREVKKIVSQNKIRWVALFGGTLTSIVLAFVMFSRWYDQAPDMPGTIPNPRLAAMFNERLALALGRMTTAHSPGLSDRAATSAAFFLTRVREVTQHCNFKQPGRAHNNVVFDLQLLDGTLAPNLYNGGFRCPSSDVPGIPIMRIRFADGVAVEVTTNGTERNSRPVDVIPALDDAIKHLISYDKQINPAGYFRTAPTPQEVRRSWEN
jgi:hypothetical protein